MQNKMGESSCTAAASTFSLEMEEKAGEIQGGLHFLLAVEEWLLNQG